MLINAENNNEIIIEDLDETHLLIKDSKIYDLKRLLDLVRCPPPSPPAFAAAADTWTQRLKETLKVEAPLDDSD